MRKSFHIAQQFDYSKKCQHLQETSAQFKFTLCPQFTSLAINSIRILHSVVSQRILILAQSLVHGSYFSAPASGDYYSLQTIQIYRAFLYLLFYLGLQMSLNNVSSEL